MTAQAAGTLALLWRGDRETRRQATPANNRWHQIFVVLAALDIRAEPAVYCEEAADEVRSFSRSMACSCGSIRSQMAARDSSWT